MEFISFNISFISHELAGLGLVFSSSRHYNFYFVTLPYSDFASPPPPPLSPPYLIFYPHVSSGYSRRPSLRAVLLGLGCSSKVASRPFTNTHLCSLPPLLLPPAPSHPPCIRCLTSLRITKGSSVQATQHPHSSSIHRPPPSLLIYLSGLRA